MLTLLRRPGLLALALGVIGKGALILVARNLALFWQPAPEWIPSPEIVAAVLGALLLVGGVGLLFARTRKKSAMGLALCALVPALARITVAVQAPARADVWESVGETAALFVGFFLLAEVSSRADRFARALFGACCVVFGISHFAYADFTATLVPSWLPAHVAFAYLTGVAHAGAGLAILIRRWDRLAATLEACMLGLFVLLVHVPSLWMSPAPKWAATAPEQWAELLIALTLAGAARTVAESLRNE